MNQSEPKSDPRPLVISNILQHSLSNDFEEAKTEWDLEGSVPSDSADFSEHCELCGARNYRGNWAIVNRNTNAILKVGTECIKRFVVLNGTETLEDSQVFFSNAEKELSLILKIRNDFPEIVKGIPTKRETTYYIKALKTLLELRGQLSLLDSREGIEEVIKAYCIKTEEKEKELDIKFVDKMYNLLHDPKKFVFQKETKRYREYKLKEGDTWKKRGRVTGTTLSSSESFKNPEKKYD
ncbi:hypothetical protein [Halalkalibacter oceani]|uniref:hypothetical protein n=1 Tax=Halalkalibacter oceani TaxID=1653776 RepID=UPI003396FE79